MDEQVQSIVSKRVAHRAWARMSVFVTGMCTLRHLDEEVSVQGVQ